jgi:hypothetical protein
MDVVASAVTGKFCCLLALAILLPPHSDNQNSRQEGLPQRHRPTAGDLISQMSGLIH